MRRVVSKLARSSTFWLGLIVNVAALLQTGQLSIAVLVGWVASYSAKEAMIALADRPLPEELAEARVFAKAATTSVVALEHLHGERPLSPAELEEAHEKLYATQIRPMLRELRELRAEGREKRDQRRRDGEARESF